MPETSKGSWIDGALYNQNRGKWTFEELAPYAGNWIAWSTDGTRIVAHRPDVVDLARAVEEMGISSEEVVLGYLPGLDEPDAHL